MVPGSLSLAASLYVVHNLVSAAVAYPVGHLGDRLSRRSVLLASYGVGVGTNLLLPTMGGSLAWLVAAIVLSGVYIAVEETLEKAVAAGMLPKELRSLGFGILACANAVGDMASSLYVGYCLEIGRPALGFGIAAGFGFQASSGCSSSLAANDRLAGTSDSGNRRVGAVGFELTTSWSQIRLRRHDRLPSFLRICRILPRFSFAANVAFDYSLSRSNTS